MLNVVYILEALRHNNMPRTTALFFFLRVEMLNVLYILEALRHNLIMMPGLLPG